MAVDNHQRKRRDVVDGILRLVRYEMDRGMMKVTERESQGKVGLKTGLPAGLTVGLRVDGSVDRREREERPKDG